MHLLLQSADGGIDGCQLSLQAVTPEGERVQLALLMATPALLRCGAVTAAKEWREHEKMVTS
ncbi:hypothetical protein [Synechococcus sp. CBW1107]|uniref:hypothetical protein n=1 Tax=Synechococcus sp. CBW1107 TaxID=2789857 RepID=UPI002AD287AA|nr:hypothetical protein [Synechococcus sp. CBW1107]